MVVELVHRVRVKLDKIHLVMDLVEEVLVKVPVILLVQVEHTVMMVV